MTIETTTKPAEILKAAGTRRVGLDVIWGNRTASPDAIVARLEEAGKACGASWTGRGFLTWAMKQEQRHKYELPPIGLPPKGGARTRGASKTHMLDEEEVLRLLDFAVNEARIKGPRGRVKGQTETMALRVVGNWCVIGRDANSPKLKELNPFMSRKAWELRGKMDLEEWTKKENTANDHWETLDHLWAWMVRDSPNSKDLLARIKKWPIVTVTKDEHKELGQWKDYGPAERYGDRIEIVRVEGASVEVI